MKRNLKIEITDFTPSHLKQVRDILRENFENPWSDSHILADNHFSVKKVALLDGEVVAFFAGEIIFSEASITMIAVKGKYQRKGIGRHLMDWFYSLAKKEGVKNIWLEVSSRNKKAIRFYEKRGFLLQDIRKGYYRDGSDALVMRLPVDI